MNPVARMRTAPPAVRWLAACGAIVVFALAPAAAAAEPAGTLHHRVDAVVVRLAPAATRALATSGPARSGDRVATLGLAGLDAIAASLGGATFEAEFPAEPRAARAMAALPARARAARDALASFYVVHLPPGTGRDAALAALRASADVASAEPIGLAPVEAVPNDSLWTRAWHLRSLSGHDIRATGAWDSQKGDSAIVVAIIDTGVLYDHPDLRARIWSNAAERDGLPGVDDDGNGFVDDVVGWDFVSLASAIDVVSGEDWASPDNDPNDFTGHGTAVAGLAGAEPDNGIGTAGAAWDVRLMPLRAGYSASAQPSGWVDLSLAAKAMVYAVNNGAAVMNLSFASGMQADLAAAADYALTAGVPMVVAAGNGQPAHFLADRPEAIAVGASDSLDHVASFSNRGTFVTLVAPGVSLPTTLLTRPAGADSAHLRQPSYTTGATGTSFSAPLVAGAVALLQSDRRERGERPLTVFELKARLAESADDIAALNPGDSGYGTGRLDMAAALADRDGSFGIALASPSVGPGVRLPALQPPDRCAWVTTDGYLVLSALLPDSPLKRVALSGVPLGGLAAADRGRGRGPALFVATRVGWLDGFDGAGRTLPGWPVAIEQASWATPSAPALGDLDGDGEIEVVWGGSDGVLRAWHLDGSPVAGLPRELGTRYAEVRVALGDLDGRPGLEIAAAVGSGMLWLLHADGTPLPGWPIPTPPGPMAPLMARVGSPPRPCVVIAASGVVSAYDTTTVPVFSRSPTGHEILPPAAADLDGDGADEIVVMRASPESLFVLSSEGVRKSAWNVGTDIAPDPGAPMLLSGARPGGAPGAVILRSLDGRILGFTPVGAPLPGFPMHGGGELSAIVTRPGSPQRAWITTGTGDDTNLFHLRAWPEAGSSHDSSGWRAARGNAARTSSTFYAPPLGTLDNVPPPAVTDFTGQPAGLRAVSLAWTAPSGDPVLYDVRWSVQPIDEADFASAHPLADPPAPAAAGSPQAFTAAGVPENATVYVALRSEDAAGNFSALSNVASVTTTGDAPARVNDVRASAWTDTSLTVAWTATGDDGTVGRPARYHLRAARTPLDPASFATAPVALDVDATADAGGAERATLRGTNLGERWWIALVAEDASGLESPLSNVLVTSPGPLAMRAGLALAPRSRPSAAPVELWWQGAGPGGARRIRIHDVSGRLVRELPLAPGDEGLATWDGRDREGARVRAGLYFAVLSAGGASAKARLVLVE